MHPLAVEDTMQISLIGIGEKGEHAVHQVCR